MKSDRARNVMLILATAWMSASCVSVSQPGNPSRTTVGSETTGYQQSTPGSQRMTKELTPPSSAVLPDELPVAEQVIRKPPNELGIIVIPGQDPR